MAFLANLIKKGLKSFFESMDLSGAKIISQVVFFIILGILLLYKYKGKITPEEIEQAFKDKTPAEVQLWRLRTILNLMNLIATIESALDQLPEPNKTAAKNVWNYGTTVERYSQTVLFIQSVTQMTDDQVDEIFQQVSYSTYELSPEK